MILPIAHHNLLLALPFVVPMLVVVLGLVVMIVRDRTGGGAGAR